mgnify:CR=1 FL=1
MRNKNNKGFTLIELLVVVAIIGALAAVGVVAYNGYTAAAKKNSTKAIHNNIVKYVASEIAKCNIEEQPFGTAGKNASVECPVTPSEVVTLLIGDDSPIQDKDPYQGDKSAGASDGGGGSPEGNVLMTPNDTTSTITFNTQVKTASSDDDLETVVSTE